MEQLPISVDIKIPSKVEIGEEFDIVIHILNRCKSIEKITLLVMLHENYLLSGSTSTFIEVS